MDNGFIKVGLFTPEIKIGNIEYNRNKVINLIKEGSKKNSKLLIFPALSLIGVTGISFLKNKYVIKEYYNAIEDILMESKNVNSVIILGAPVIYKGGLLNTALAIYKGEIIGVFPCKNLSIKEKEVFINVENINDLIFINDYKAPIYSDFIIKNLANDFSFSVCIESLNGMNLLRNIDKKEVPSIIINLSNEHYYANKKEEKINETVCISRALGNTIISLSPGIGESSTDFSYMGDGYISERGDFIVLKEIYSKESFYYDVNFERNRSSDILKNISYEEYININTESDLKDRILSKTPYLPSSGKEKNNYFNETLLMQVQGLKKRLESTGINKIVLGVSGGLDSTLALLVGVMTLDIMGLPRENMYAVTMPSFGTSGRTYNNAVSLMKKLNVSFKEINIKEEAELHLKLIGHDINNKNVTYENTQARIRTLILMDLANDFNGIVLGTGDLSESMLGWCTYNGDHMSMYNVNGGLLKSLMKHLVLFICEKEQDKSISKILMDIVNTPISPELIPPEDGDSSKVFQVTEDKIGPYELHDFFIYYFLKYNYSPYKIFSLGINAFNNSYTKEEVLQYLEIFFKRYYDSQYKRSCQPDGVGIIKGLSVSPREGVQIPSDMDKTIILKEIDRIRETI